MADSLDPAERARLDRLLLRYMERDEEDMRNGRTREHHEKMLQRVIDEQQSVRLELTRRDAEIDKQFMSLRMRTENVEGAVVRLGQRVDKIEGKVEDVEETTGNYQIDGLKDYKKTAEKWKWAFIGAIFAVVVTVIGAAILAKAGIDSAKHETHEAP